LRDQTGIAVERSVTGSAFERTDTQVLLLRERIHRYCFWEIRQALLLRDQTQAVLLREQIHRHCFWEIGHAGTATERSKKQVLLLREQAHRR
jgi:hypothetical protein